jgi:hypothetical protein
MHATPKPTRQEWEGEVLENRVEARSSRDGDVAGMLAIYPHHIRRVVNPGSDGEFEAEDRRLVGLATV